MALVPVKLSSLTTIKCVFFYLNCWSQKRFSPTRPFRTDPPQTLLDFRISEKSFVLFNQYPPDEDFFYLIGVNFSHPKTCRCASTNQSYHEYSLGTKLSTKGDLRLTPVWAGIEGHGIFYFARLPAQDSRSVSVRERFFVSAQSELEKV